MAKMKLFTMLVWHDRTVENAFEVYKESKKSMCKDWGCKDIGIPKADIEKLISTIKADHNTTYMEMMGSTEQDFVNTANFAVKAKINVVIGGKYYDSVANILKENSIEYYPFIGELVGNPRVLKGTIEDIVKEAKTTAKKNVSGVTVAIYRFNGDKEALLNKLNSEIDAKIVVAGSVNSKERVQELAKNGIYGITIGSSFFQKDFVKDGSFADNVDECLNWIKEA